MIPFCGVSLFLQQIGKDPNFDFDRMSMQQCNEICQTIPNQLGEGSYGEGGGDLSLTNIFQEKDYEYMRSLCPNVCEKVMNDGEIVLKVGDIHAFNLSVGDKAKSLKPLDICNEIYRTATFGADHLENVDSHHHKSQGTATSSNVRAQDS